jgi:hypothetical protein
MTSRTVMQKQLKVKMIIFLKMEDDLNIFSLKSMTTSKTIMQKKQQLKVKSMVVAPLRVAGL